MSNYPAKYRVIIKQRLAYGECWIYRELAHGVNSKNTGLLYNQLNLIYTLYIMVASLYVIQNTEDNEFPFA